MEYVPTAEEAVIFTSTNLTIGLFSPLYWTLQDVAWMANVHPWSKMNSYDVTAKIADFLNGSNIANKSEAAPQLASFLGVAVDRVQMVYEEAIGYYDTPFPDLVEMIKEIIPLAGHPAHNSGLFIGILVMFTVLMALCLGLRIYSRILINGAMRTHDYVMFAGALVTLGLSIMNAACLSGPTHFRGLWDRSWQDMRVDSTSSIATSVLYPISVLIIKSSLLIFYWTLTAWSPLRVGAGITWAVVFGNCLAMIFTSVYRCKYPVGGDSVDAYWYNKCNSEMFILATDVTGSLNIVTDVVIWMIPLPMIWKITQTFRERLLASLTLGVGVLACIACGFRFYSLRRILRLETMMPPDQSEYLMWTMTELYLAIICSCVPAIRALIIKKAPSFIGSSGDSVSEIGKYDDKTENKRDIDINVESYSNREGSPA